MAMIKCNECGNMISDMSSVCIHCGAPIKLSTLEKKAEEKSKKLTQEVDEKNLKDFDLLDKEKQAELEREFWESDKEAEIFRRKYESRMRITFLSLGYMFFALITFLLTGADELCISYPNWLTVKNTILRDLTFFGDIPMIPIVIFVIGFIASIISIFLGLDMARRRVAYKKKFCHWLKTNKKILYTPMFIDSNESHIWETTDINDKL